ncbi:MAG: cytochrome c oxidase accessory protein CcoG [Phycisphaerales bacterium]
METEDRAGASAASVEAPRAPSVLSTLNDDGSRRWLRPRLSKGRFLVRRRVVAYGLVALFAALPFLTINGRPAVLLDIVRREFTFFGVTFLPTDTLLLALFIVSVFVTIFAATALFGRVWCGWACPQTVYLEFLYRPIERLFEGGPGVKARVPLPQAVRKPVKYAVYLVVSVVVANIFLSYFVGVETLGEWVRQSPLEHPTGFLVVAFVTAAMMFDFCFFREQTCIVACPYGRFQSVMLDRNSLIISYDYQRGEPRGKMKKQRSRDPETGDVRLKTIAGEQGDCIDCHMCVTTCPTGIDIRNGLQMECIGCAQCIDACDAVMDKVGRDRGLIRYSTQAGIEGGKSRIVRPRLFVYAGVLGVLSTLFVLTLASKGAADVSLLRGQGLPYVIIDGEVTNEVRVKVVNRTREVASYTISIESPAGARFLGLEAAPTVEVGPGESETISLRVGAARAAFTDGGAEAVFLVTAADGYEDRVAYRLLGPRGAAPGGEDGGS